MTQLIDFLEHSRKITQHFLQSVVAVDDNMEFKSRTTDIHDDILNVPDDDDFGQIDLDENSGKVQAPLEHKLYYQDLSLEFAKKGIVCGGFSPTTNNELSLDAIVNTSKNSDITILDWQMQISGADGQLAKDTIIRIANDDIADGGRTRLICIYTAEDANVVANCLCKTLNMLSPELANLTLEFNLPALSHWKIEIVNKKMQEVELCNFLINSFATLTAGLLSNAALSAIASIRDNTHNLLHKFNSSLDPAYLSHVLGLISSPDMREQANNVAFDYAVDLISEELKSELQTSQIVKDSLSNDKLNSWPNFVNNKNDPFCFRLKLGTEDSKKFGNDVMIKLIMASTDKDLEDILENDIGLKALNDKKPLSRYNKLPIQLTTFVDANTSLLELCSLESVRRDITTIKNGHVPVLKQGTIVKIKNEDSYYICIQPVCDSVRLVGDSTFSLMKIRVDKSSFTHVIRGKKSHLKLNISPLPKNIRTFSFIPNEENKVVSAITIGDTFIFNLDSGLQEFEWCGELKQAVSQAIINGLASQLSRVGLDSFEWLRLRQQMRQTT